MSGAAPSLVGISAVKLALMARKVREQSAAALRADPIAIVGMGCQLPGGADTPDRLWQLICDGVETVGPIPADRWDAEAWYDPDLSTAGKAVTKRGSFLDRIDSFDHGFFGIPEREAERMDPQHRLFLEVAIEALDDAGLPRQRLAGSRTGVFIASYHNDYTQLQYADRDAIDLRTLTGTLHSVLANRLSYLLDLRGPSLSIDTACSSSLVALHLACQSLRLGECDIAVTGGVSLIIAPELLVAMSKVGFMAPDGRCKAFDAAADGFGRGEGCSVVVLKRLSDAIVTRDRVLAVIRGSAVNQDGHSTVLTAPSGPAQEALIREALSTGQIAAERIGFVETHGTGTVLGDPIEVEAIAAAVGRPSPAAGPCLLGSVKANLGHLEAAAGATGLIKAVLALRHGAVPPQPQLGALNPHLSLAGTRLAIPRALTSWPAGAAPRCAAVSSFGVGGTNAHVVLEEAPAQAEAPKVADGPCLLPLSATTPTALRDLAGRWVDFLAETSATAADIAFSAAQRRTHHAARIAVVGQSTTQLRDALVDFLATSAAEPRAGSERRLVAFVFSGQGPQWYAMGRELLAAEPAFRDAMQACDVQLRALAGWSLLEELARSAADSRLDQTEIAQPALFALQVSLAALWRCWGVAPDMVVGHSVGEIAALHVAGVLSLAEAVRLAWIRGRVMQQATGLGRMAAVGLGEAEARAVIAPFGDRLSIGAVNAPGSVVLSGEAEALNATLARLEASGVDHRLLPVNYAFHSAQMAPFQDLLVAEIGALRGAAPRIPLYSTVTGGLAQTLSFDANYFARNMRETVRFAPAIEAMSDAGCELFIELSPHPVLRHAIVAGLAEHGREARVMASLRRGKSERETMLQACAGLYDAGRDLTWERVQGTGQVVSLPAYPWQRTRHWLRRQLPRLATEHRRERHPLLGRRITVAGVDAIVFEGGPAAAQSWLADHRVFGRLLMPAAAVMELLLAAAAQAMAWPRPQLTGFAMLRPLTLPEADADPAVWQVVVRPLPTGAAQLTLFVARMGPGGVASAWQEVASATAEADACEAALAIGTSGHQPADVSMVYARFAALDIAFGPSFQCLHEVALGEGGGQAEVVLPAALHDTTDGHLLHPVLLDAALQLCSLAAASDIEKAPEAVFLPLGADRIVLHPGRYDRVLSSVRIVATGSGTTLTADIQLRTPGGAPLGSIQGMRFARAERDAVLRDAAERTDDAPDALCTVSWVPAPEDGSREPVNLQGAWWVFTDSLGTADHLADAIEAAGGRCHRVRAGADFARLGLRQWTIDPTDPAQYQRILDASGWRDATLRGGVIHAWSLDTRPAELIAAETLEQDDATCVGSALQLLQCLAATPGEAGPVWFITRGAQSITEREEPASLRPRGAGLWGLAGVAVIEHPELRIRLVDLDPADDAATLSPALLEHAAPRIGLRHGTTWLPRMRPYSAANGREIVSDDSRPVRVEMVRPGSFAGLELRPQLSADLQPGEVRLRVLAAGLNFRDVLTVLQMYPGAPPPLGVECAGIVTEVGRAVDRFRVGDRAFGFAPASFASEVTVPEQFLAAMPAAMRAEDAAGLPVAFLTAHYGLHQLAHLAQGERVLVHAAAGGVGLAAVQLAQNCGAEIFATAGSPAKRDMLRRLGVAHIMDSRSLTFADEILAATGGQGVDVVLNSLAGEFIPAGFRALGRHGRFLELGKRGIWSAADVAAIRPDVAYHPYDLGELAQADHNLLRPIYDTLLAALANDTLRPLPVTIFPLARVGEAMRHMAQARHVGKVVLRVAADPAFKATDAVSVTAAATYWITGGLGALGLQTAAWLVSAGARHLVLTGRHAPGVAASRQIQELEQLGATVRVIAADAGDHERMSSVLDEITRTMPPLRGVVHAAGVVRDAVLLRQRWSEAREVMRGKAHGAWLLHELTRSLPLDFFILYSAGGVVLGAPGQGLYPAANAELDALAHLRRRLGLPALSVAWGSWSGEGMAAAAAARGTDVWEARGLRRIDAATGFACLARLLADRATYAAVIPLDWRQFLGQLPPGSDRRFFDAMAPAVAAPAVEGPALCEQLRMIPSSRRRQALITELGDRVALLLGLARGTAVELRVPLRELGVDSLMAVELRNVLVRAGGAPLPATLLFDHPTLEALATHLQHIWALGDGEAATASPSKTAAAPDEARRIAALSEADAEVMLLEELVLGETRRSA